MGVPPLYLLPTPNILYNLYNYSITLHFVQLFKRDFRDLYLFQSTLKRAVPVKLASFKVTLKISECFRMASTFLEL